MIEERRKAAKMEREHLLEWNNSFEGFCTIFPPYFISDKVWEKNEAEGKQQRHRVFQNAVKQAVPQTYRSCEAPAVNTHNQPASIFTSHL